MATFTDIANEIIAETALNDIAVIVYPYLYDTVKSICGLREDWPFMETSKEFTMTVGLHTWALSTTNFNPPIRNVKSFKYLDTAGDLYRYPDFVDPDVFERSHQNDYGITGTITQGKPSLYTIMVVEGSSTNSFSMTWRPAADTAYTFYVTYYIEHPTAQGATIYVPNTELIKAGVKMRIYGDRGDTAAVEFQAALFKLALKDLNGRYSASSMRGEIRLRRYF